MEGKLKFLRYIAYAIEILLLYILSGTAGLLPSVMGVRPLLLLPAALMISVFESEQPAMYLGFVCGALIDVGSDARIGYYTVILTVLCFALGYCARNFYVVSFLNAMVVGAIAVTVILLLDFFIFSGAVVLPHAGLNFLRHWLIRIIYTLVFLPPLYWFNRLFCGAMEL